MTPKNETNNVTMDIMIESNKYVASIAKPITKAIGGNKIKPSTNPKSSKSVRYII